MAAFMIGRCRLARACLYGSTPRSAPLRSLRCRLPLGPGTAPFGRVAPAHTLTVDAPRGPPRAQRRRRPLDPSRMRGPGRAARLPVDANEAMDRGERGQHEHHPENRYEDVERERDAEEHEALGALHQAAARVEAERLGPRPL